MYLEYRKTVPDTRTANKCLYRTECLDLVIMIDGRICCSDHETTLEGVEASERVASSMYDSY